jgi:hypothetical protein
MEALGINMSHSRPDTYCEHQNGALNLVVAWVAVSVFRYKVGCH